MTSTFLPAAASGPRLGPPPALTPDALRITPLGGLGDVGRNCATVEYQGRLLIIDCGVLFPEDNHPGVDLILPALELLRPRIADVEALLLTHGHEDHVGAVPYLLRMRSDIPIYGSRLTLALLREKLREHRLPPTQFHEVAEGDIAQLGGFDVEFLAVNHSIPDALALHVRTPAGSLLHTGDFKMDQLPLDGRITDLRAFARAGEQRIDLFMVDSTNAEVPGFTPSEREVEPALERVFAGARQRLVVACFASHVHRVQQILDLAVAHGRKVAYVGRSMVRNMAVARDLGFLRVPANTVIDMRDVENHRPEDVVIICTGSQGEPLSALARMAGGEHPAIDLRPGDTVLLASSLIPGNETSVYRVINGLASQGVRVVHKGNALVHVSGHASAGELLYAYNVVRPRNVMPVHGEVRHLIANAELAHKTGVARENIVVVEDGAVIDLVGGRARVVGQVEASYVFVDGASVGSIGDAELTDRRILGEEGFVSVIAVVDLHGRRVVRRPDIYARGVVEDDTVFDGVRDDLERALSEALADGVTDPHALRQVLRRTIGRWVNQKMRRRPMIVPTVVTT